MEKYNALSQFQSPNLRRALADAVENNTVLLGVGAGIASVEVAKVVAATQADWIFIDAEHTPLSPSLLRDLVQTYKIYSGGKMIPVVRVPTHTAEWIGWVLDAGAGGVIIPHTETADQVRASIAASRFPPLGHRSFPPAALLPGIQDIAPASSTWFEVANENVAVIPQIESKLGVDNLEEIMQIKGVDCIMIGFTDLGMDLGADRKDLLGEAVARIESLARKYNMPLLGFGATEAFGDKCMAGYRMMIGIADVWTLAFGINQTLAEERKVIEDTKAKAQTANEA